MTAFLLGPVFFGISVGLLLLGAMLLAGVFRQGWILLAGGFVGLGLAVVGWLTVAGAAGVLVCVGGYFFWSRHNIGRSL